MYYITLPSAVRYGFGLCIIAFNIFLENFSPRIDPHFSISCSYGPRQSKADMITPTKHSGEVTSSIFTFGLIRTAVSVS